jgi:hypothetical protein
MRCCSAIGRAPINGSAPADAASASCWRDSAKSVISDATASEMMELSSVSACAGCAESEPRAACTSGSGRSATATAEPPACAYAPSNARSCSTESGDAVPPPFWPQPCSLFRKLIDPSFGLVLIRSD